MITYIDWLEQKFPGSRVALQLSDIVGGIEDHSNIMTHAEARKLHEDLARGVPRGVEILQSLPDGHDFVGHQLNRKLCKGL